MQENDEKTLTRREFLRLAATLASAAAVTGGGFVAYRKTRSKGIPRLNPAFRVNEISADEVELYTHFGNGGVLKHRFSGVEADLLREIEKEQEIQPLVATLAQKHDLSVKVCRQMINQSLREFEEAKLIYYGPKMLVKIVEVKNG